MDRARTGLAGRAETRHEGTHGRSGVSLSFARRDADSLPSQQPTLMSASPTTAAAAPSKSAAPYLPLTRPTIDEETIAGVGDVLRSGWITSGPNVKALAAKLSEHCDGRPVRV